MTFEQIKKLVRVHPGLSACGLVKMAEASHPGTKLSTLSSTLKRACDKGVIRRAKTPSSETWYYYPA